MGREIRRVPADWEHPKTRVNRYTLRGIESVEEFQPQHDRDYETEAREWLDNAIAWDNGTHKACAENKVEYPFYWQYSNNPPDPKYYRPKWTSEPTHYQIYETVSEGTPVTPHFATKEELIDYLVENGDFWDQQRAKERGEGKAVGWNRARATDFVNEGWAPSLIMEVNASGTRMYEPKDGFPPGIQKKETE
jgi:hypothetical protein